MKVFRVYRFEHRQAFCQNYRGNHGHGPHVGGNCLPTGRRPPFGDAGSPPEEIAPYERCAVTIEQFPQWVSRGSTAKNCPLGCKGVWCGHPFMPVRLDKDEFPEWALIEYEIDSSQEGMTWHEDQNQIVFDPEYAKRIGEVPVSKVYTSVDNLVTA